MKSKVKLVIKGKNPNRFLLRLAKNHINLLELDKKASDEYYVIIYYKDYEKVLKLNTIYDIHIVEYGGFLKEKKSLLKNKWFIGSLVIACLLLFFLSKMIFSVEIVTNDQKMRKLLLDELKTYGIDRFHFQKSYQELEKVKEKMLNDYHDQLEWLEIERIGTTYKVRYEPRILTPDKEETSYRHVVAAKNAIIQKVESSEGQILKNQNDYVKKGDIIVSGYVSLNGNVKKTVSATGTVYGETWYEVEVFYPFGYYEQTKTGKKKTVYVLEFFSHRIELFNFHPFYDKIYTSEVLLEKKPFPVRFVKDYQEEVHTESVIATLEEAKEKAISLAISKIEKTLSGEEKILNYKVVHEAVESNGVKLQVFFSVYEDITEYLEIPLYEEEEHEGDFS